MADATGDSSSEDAGTDGGDAGLADDDGNAGDAPGDGGAADTADDPTADTTADAPDTLPDAGPAGTLAESGDWADCLDEAACPGHALAAGLTVALDASTGVLEREGHLYTALDGVIEAPGSHPFGYDADFIAIQAPARTVVTVEVAPLGPGSAIDPFVTTADFGHPGEDFAFQEITSNDQRAPGDLAARTTIAAPFDDAPFYVWVDDARNVLGTDTVGGDAFTYRLSFAVAPFAPTEIDVADGSGGVSGVDLAQAGDVHFYRFAPPSDGQQWRVTLTTANTDFFGYLIGFDTRGGRLQPVGYAGEESWAPTREIGPEAFRVDARNEYVFAVTDWLGRGSNTSDSLFFYEVSVASQ